MPITRKVEASYYDSAGRRYATIEEARIAEIGELMKPYEERTGCALSDGGKPAIVSWINENADSLVAILTTGPRSRPKARRVAGTTSPKRAARRATAEQVSNGIAAMREAVDSQPVEAA